ncbi:hypothetical protein [Arthrobacter sp. PsM3]|uniref:hypothetical protein n=1 Tax=Arthrobacter sp. PsM3 TaxID=3030531 RepID=UPI00263ACF9E|nr:hypothetical protein [Arthrobacter sp. PsM3]MDN4645716.1 hypothetical protein [Arthrobacter sp. PsM3]
MSVSIGAGLIIGPIGVNTGGDAEETLVILAVWLLGIETVLPLLLSGILGGEAIMAGGGFIGFSLIAGLFAFVAGGTDQGLELLGPVWAPWAFGGDIALTVLAGAGFSIIGWIARVPMWLQAPVLGAPRICARIEQKPRRRRNSQRAGRTVPVRPGRQPQAGQSPSPIS